MIKSHRSTKTLQPGEQHQLKCQVHTKQNRALGPEIGPEINLGTKEERSRVFFYFIPNVATHGGLY